MKSGENLGILALKTGGGWAKKRGSIDPSTPYSDGPAIIQDNLSQCAELCHEEENVINNVTPVYTRGQHLLVVES